jgi:hypothetical protein
LGGSKLTFARCLIRHLPFLVLPLLFPREPRLDTASSLSDPREAIRQFLDLNRLKILEEWGEGRTEEEVELLNEEGSLFTFASGKSSSGLRRWG